MKTTTTIFFKLIIVCSTAFACQSNKKESEQKEPHVTKPNILLVLLDDISVKELSIYGDSNIITPTIDEMASNGVVFKTAWSQPVCGPTRAALLTAKYAHKNGHYSNKIIPSESIHTKHYTMGNAMKDAGYRTGWFGKQHIDREKNPDDFGFDHYVICKYWEGYDGPTQGRGSENDRAGNMYGAEWYWHPAILANGKGVPTTPEDFGPNIEVDSLLAFIEMKSGQPFFAYWPTNLPHHEYNPDKETWDRPDVPEFSVNGKMTGNRIDGNMKSNIEYVDIMLQKILDKLSVTGQLDNTIIFLLGDNGTAGYGKGKTESEIALHVPFVAYGPRLIKPQGMSDVLVDVTDMMPTFLELAKYQSDKIDEMDGKSFAPYLLGKPFNPRNWISAQYDSARWIRTREWLIDGDGTLWYCGDQYDEQKFKKITDLSSEKYGQKKEELQALMDKNIPKL